MRPLIALVCALFFISPAGASELEPFATDGCSVWIDGPPKHPNLWRHCCVAHDLAYWIGGTKAQRRKADDELKRCIFEAQRPMLASQTTFYGVRMGGGPYWPMSYRWGFGWNYWDGKWLRGYKTLTTEEQAQVEQLMSAALHVIAEDALKNPPQ